MIQKRKSVTGNLARGLPHCGGGGLVRGRTCQDCLSTITFSDGQTVDSGNITRVTLLAETERLLVETAEGPIRIQGAGVHADTAMLKDVRKNGKQYFMVHEK